MNAQLNDSEIKGIYIDCENQITPRKWPSTGRVGLVTILDSLKEGQPTLADIDFFQLSENNDKFGVPETIIDTRNLLKDEHLKHNNGIECSIINYSTDTIISITFDMEIHLSRKYRNDGYVTYCTSIYDESAGAEVNRTRDVHGGMFMRISVAKLDVGVENAYTFYIFNESRHTAYVFLPKEGEGTRLGSESGIHVAMRSRNIRCTEY